MVLPSVSVIVASFDREERLRNCVRALAALDYPADRLTLEIVDDGSPHPLAPVVAAMPCRFRVRVHRQANRGPAAARNLGAAHAGGELLAFTDDDCEPDPSWPAALARAHLATHEALIGGRVENGIAGNVYSEASQQLLDFIYERHSAGEGGAPYFAAMNMACSRRAFLEIGGFDERFPGASAEDREFGLRWRRSGRPMRFAAEAVVRHHHVLSLREFWVQHANYGAGSRHLRRLKQEPGKRRLRFEPLGFYFDLITHPLRRRGPAGLSDTMLMMISQLAMLQGYLQRPTRRN